MPCNLYVAESSVVDRILRAKDTQTGAIPNIYIDFLAGSGRPPAVPNSTA